MLYAQKDNRQYVIAPEDKQKYINRGYRIAELKGDKLVFEAQKPGATALVGELKAQLAKAIAENKELKEQLAKAKPEKAEEKKKGEGK